MLAKSRDKLVVAIIAVVLVAVIGAALYVLLPGKFVIADVSRAETYRLATDRESHGIYALELSGRGKFAGTLKLELLTKDSKVIREVSLDNGGSFELQNDWYSSEAFIRVTPGTATGGSLTLRYRFVGFR